MGGVSQPSNKIGERLPLGICVRDEPLLTAIAARFGLSDYFSDRKRSLRSAMRALVLNCHDVFKINERSGFARHFAFPSFSFVMCFLISLWPLGVNKCRIASSVVMSFGCFFFFLG
jgi:hypothetical protein